MQGSEATTAGWRCRGRRPALGQKRFRTAAIQYDEVPATSLALTKSIQCKRKPPLPRLCTAPFACLRQQVPDAEGKQGLIQLNEITVVDGCSPGS